MYYVEITAVSRSSRTPNSIAGFTIGADAGEAYLRSEGA